jgi:hypothetical protein
VLSTRPLRKRFPSTRPLLTPRSRCIVHGYENERAEPDVSNALIGATISTIGLPLDSALSLEETRRHARRAYLTSNVVQNMKKPRTPQEKKKLSYQRDRRNMYGQNAHASRKAIPKRKRDVTQSLRKRTNQVIPKLQPLVAVVDDCEIEEKIGRVVPKRWRKCPDMPLGEAIRLKKARKQS